MKIKAVIFDMDGTMFDTEKTAIACWIQAAKIYGYQLENEWLEACIGQNLDRTIDILSGHVGELFPFSTVAARADEMMVEKYRLYGIPMKEGLMDLLEILQDLQLPLAVATSTHREKAEMMLQLAGVRQYFKVVVCGDEVEHSKPHPEIIEKACMGLDKNPSNCLVLEDSYAGVEAASTAGAPVIFIPDALAPNDLVKDKAMKILPSLSTVAKLFKK